ncbi:MAG: hypothetical protein RML56_11590 [Burkholderiales bacterium]|nr:hypothetical protein [Burkholderiales bacterium]
MRTAARRGKDGHGGRRADGALRRGGEHPAGRARLEEAGAHVVYGVVGHKTHCEDGARRAPRGGAFGGRCCGATSHLATGNYHLRRPRASTPTSGCSPRARTITAET